MPPTPPLKAAVTRLAKERGTPPPPAAQGPFELILWENVAYLADDARRKAAFDLLRQSVGTTPASVHRASPAALAAVTKHGILNATFAAKLRDAARIAIEEFDGDLDALVRQPRKAALQGLRRFPGIGLPGAEKILLLSRQHPSLAPESNALRVMIRLGVIAETRSYAKTYAAAQAAATAQLGSDFDDLIRAHHLLRHHGQAICRRSNPACDRCPLVAMCAHASIARAPSVPRRRTRP